MVREYKYKDKTFSIDDSKGCFVEVSYEGLTGYAGVWVAGTPTGPYGWSTSRSAVSPDGIKGGNLGVATFERASIRCA